MPPASLLPHGPYRWWVPIAAYLLSLGILVGMSVVPLPGEISQPMNFLAYVVLAAMLTLIVTGRGAAAVAALGLRVESRARTIIIGLLGAAATHAIAATLQMGTPPASNSTALVLHAMGMGENAGRDLLLVLSIGALAPVGEEALYRGLIFKGTYDALARFGRWLALAVALALSSALFSEAHGGEGQTGMVLVVLALHGAIYALCYVLSGNIWAPVLAHAINNTVALAQAIFPSDSAVQAATLAKYAIPVMPLLALALLALWRRAMR